MIKTQVRELIYKELEQRICDPTFRLKKGEGFVRLIPSGKQVIGIPLVDYNPEFQFSLNICIRIEAVEKLLHKFLGSAPKYQKLSFTYTARLKHFTSPQDRWLVVFTPDDISKAAARLGPVLSEKIIPFLDSHHDLSAVADAMNLTYVPDMIPGPGPAMQAVIVARLTRNPHFEHIVAAYQPLVARFPSAMKDMFQNLVTTSETRTQKDKD